jgi:mannose-6-phosphate isomerase-like protein (cupin superfamily)
MRPSCPGRLSTRAAGKDDGVDHLPQAGRYSPPVGDDPTSYVEHVRTAALSLGTYSIPAGGVDDQVPHAQDEVYVVLAGRGSFTGAGTTVAVQPGSVLAVPAGEEHRFHDVAEDLAVLVVFAPPYRGRG